MSLGEPQYYEGKVFLKALLEAHKTLEYGFVYAGKPQKSKPN